MFKLIRANNRLSFKKPLGLILSAVLPMILIIVMNYIITKDNEDVHISIGFVNNDPQAVSFIDEIQKESIHSEEEALKMLENGDLKTIVTIPENFIETLDRGEIPTLDVRKRGEHAPSISMLMLLRDKMMQRAKTALLKEVPGFEAKKVFSNAIEVKTENAKGVDASKDSIVLLFICYFSGMGAGVLATRLLTFKNNGVLERLITAPNSPRAAIGGIFGSYILLNSIADILVMVILYFVVKIQVGSFFLISIYFILLSCINLGVALNAARYIKNEQTVSLPITGFGMLTFFGYLMYMIQRDFGTVSKLLEIANLMNPLYWAIEGMTNNAWFPHIPILVLMVGILFTFGTISMRNFIRAQH
ncbi:ABC transporter permease [Guggenheimella bovis]